jgi:hypothetical protein
VCLANLRYLTKKLESEGWGEQLPSASNYEPYMCTSYNPLVADGGCDMGYQPLLSPSVHIVWMAARGSYHFPDTLICGISGKYLA